MEKQKKSVGTIALVVLLLLVTVASLILATYAWAKYTTTTGQQSATANVAKWNVTLNSVDDSFVGTYQHVVDGKIAPGTSGSFEVNINGLAQTEVCVGYSVTLDGVTNQPAHLKFFSDSTYTHEITPGGTGDTNVAFSGTIDLDTHNTTPANNAKTDVNTVGASGTVTNGTLTKTIYWVWPYDREAANNITAYSAILANETTNEAYDANDTTDGRAANEMTLNFTVKAWQVQPE